ncbi:efflux RND transporter permease subunit, partial [bacterium]|nr:efflux RND transporter permease subunit [bacterium]
MNFIDYSVEKFITIISIFLLSFIFGLISLQSIPVQLVPTVEKPKITIRTNWQGASPEEIEREIVIRQEDKLKSLEGLELMESTSIENQATIKLELKEGRNIESSLIQVSNLLAQVKNIPTDSDKPTIKSISSDRSPMAWFILKAKKENINIFEYKDFAEDYIKTRFERVEGVGESGIRGGRFKEVQIDIDTNKLAFLEVSLLDIVDEIKKNNVDISSGAIEEGKRKYTARTTGEIKNIDDLKKIIIKEDNNNYISLGDISKINIGYEDENYIVRHLGENAIAINVIKETGANTIKVHKDLLIAMNELNDGPLKKENLILTNVYSDTTYIDASISSVKQNLFLGAFLAILVLLFFLKSMKTTLIIALAIPISTVSSFIIFEFMGRTLNLISLAGISFAVGMVVDNSLVVLENIFSKFESGVKDPKKAAIEGAKEVAGAILASTMTTFAVFLPILFLTSEIGQLFKDIALSISISIIISFFVSLTFIPGLASKILDYDSLSDLGSKKKLFTKFDNIGIFFNQKINSLLSIILQKSQNLLKFLIIILSSTLLLFFLTFPKLEYLPEGNRNLIISVLIPPQGYNID